MLLSHSGNLRKLSFLDVVLYFSLHRKKRDLGTRDCFKVKGSCVWYLKACTVLHTVGKSQKVQNELKMYGTDRGTCTTSTHSLHFLLIAFVGWGQAFVNWLQGNVSKLLRFSRELHSSYCSSALWLQQTVCGRKGTQNLCASSSKLWSHFYQSKKSDSFSISLLSWPDLLLLSSSLSNFMTFHLFCLIKPELPQEAFFLHIKIGWKSITCGFLAV